MKEVKFSYENQKVTLYVDQEEAGFIKLAGEEIEYISIEENFRGMGFYKMLLYAALQMHGREVLYSMNRNEYSNPAYCHWTNDPDLDENALVCIGFDKTKEGIDFMKM